MADRLKNLVKLRAAAKIADDVGTVPEVILELLLREYASHLAAIERGEVAMIRTRLAEVQETLRERLAILQEENRSARSIAALNARIGHLSAIRSHGLQDIADSLQMAAERTVALSSQTITKTISAVAPEAQILAGFNVLSPSQLAQVSRRDILGANIQEWIRSIDISGEFGFERELRASFFAGESVPKTAQRIAKLVAKDGHDAVTVARTTLQGIANQAARETYEANSDILSGMIWIATLDSRVCSECMMLDGQRVKFGESLSPPVHPSCRCVLAPDVKGFAPPKVPTTREWLERQPDAIQQKVLGRGIAGLVKSGRISMDDIVDAQGKPRTLQRLQELARPARKGGKAA